MYTSQLKKEFEEKFGSVFEGVHLDHGVHSGFRILTELEESLLSWFLSKLSQAQAEAREEAAKEIDELASVADKYYNEDNTSHGLRHERNALWMAAKRLRSKFPPQTN